MAIPSFTTSTSTELNDLFYKIRTRLILPRRLSPEQKALIYKTSKIHVLKEEGIAVTVAGERFKLEHIDRTVDIPDRKKIFDTAIKTMQPGDWDNFPSLCQAYLELMGRLPTVWIRKAIKSAAEAGRLDIILEAARRGHRTGFLLYRKQSVRQAMLCIRQEALDRKWDSTSLKKALTRAEMLVELLDHEDHCGDIQYAKAAHNPRACCDVVATVLELAAIRDLKYLGGEDRDGKVLTYAKRLAGTKFKVGDEPDEQSGLREEEQHHVRNSLLIRAVGVLHAVKMTERVLGVDHMVVKELKQKAVQLENMVSEYVEEFRARNDYPKSGVQLYDQLLGADSKGMVTAKKRDKKAIEGSKQVDQESNGAASTSNVAEDIRVEA